MPYKSKAQRRWFQKNLPKVAARWNKMYSNLGLPERVTPKVKTKTSRRKRK